MLNRAIIVDENFVKLVRAEQFPVARSTLLPEQANLDKAAFLDLFDSQLISRHLDLHARVLKDRNLSYYTIGSSGHEGNAALGLVFRHSDLAFLHYRSGAFMVQRLKKMPECDSIYDLMLSFVASCDDPISGGRHKVLGSLPAFIPPQTSTIASHLPKAVGAAFSLTLAKMLNHTGKLPHDSVIVCSFGDASLNHSVSQGAMNAAQWIAHGSIPLPLVFICEDNGIGISVPTPQNWIAETVQCRSSWHYIAADGLNLADVYRAGIEAEHLARKLKKPVFLHMKCVRLMGHAGSDIEQHYKTAAAIEMTEANDPLLHTARMIRECDYLSAQEIIARYQATAARVVEVAERALKTNKLTSAKAVMSSLIPPIAKRKMPMQPAIDARQKTFGAEWKQLSEPRNLCQNINFALADLLLQYPEIVVFGEDVAKKGGVYRVTAGLQEKFGQKRVFDSLLDETTILGQAIGMAHNGFLPIPEIQFLAYYHNAEDQIRGEAATLSFFSKGQYTNPMVVRIAGLAYQKGFGGHFHNDNSFAAIRDVPGVIIACPSHGADAAKMLRTCVKLAYEQQRIVIFLEPIALYMVKDLHEANDQGWLNIYPASEETIAFGEMGIYGTSNELVILTYGNGFYLSRQAEKIINDRHQVKIKIVDLRWLAPLNKEGILAAVKNAKNILIVDECRKTGSLSEELVTLLVENMPQLPKIKRLTGEDSFIPLGQAWEYVLPSRDNIVAAVEEMLELSDKKTSSPKKAALNK